MPVKTVRTVAAQAFGCAAGVLSYSQAFRAKNLALGATLADQINEFKLLADFAARINASGGYAAVESDVHLFSDRRYKAVFVAAVESREYFKYGRLWVTHDCAFAWSIFKGIIMTATTVDASNQLVYLAMAHYAGNEGRGAWVWFMRHCRAAFRDMRHPLCTMNSDGEKGFPGAAREVYGERVLLQRCAQHLEGSVRKAHGAAAATLFMPIAQATNRALHDAAVARMRAAHPAATSYVLGSTPAWALSHLPEVDLTAAGRSGAFGRVSNQAAESTNSAMAGIRGLSPFRAAVKWVEFCTSKLRDNRAAFVACGPLPKPIAEVVAERVHASTSLTAEA